MRLSGAASEQKTCSSDQREHQESTKTERLKLSQLHCPDYHRKTKKGTWQKDFSYVTYAVHFNARTSRTEQERKTTSLLVILYSLTLEHQKQTKADKYFVCHS